MNKARIFSAMTVAMISLICLADASAQTAFQPVWRTAPRDSGVSHPSSIAWSMTKSEIDLVKFISGERTQ
jgi:hypothetical protein